MDSDKKIGTKAAFRSWLEFHKNVTYTEYTKFSPEKKVSVQKEYAGKNKKKTADAQPEA